MNPISARFVRQILTVTSTHLKRNFAQAHELLTLIMNTKERKVILFVDDNELHCFPYSREYYNEVKHFCDLAIADPTGYKVVVFSLDVEDFNHMPHKWLAGVANQLLAEPFEIALSVKQDDKLLDLSAFRQSLKALLKPLGYYQDSVYYFFIAALFEQTLEYPVVMFNLITENFERDVDRLARAIESPSNRAELSLVLACGSFFKRLCVVWDDELIFQVLDVDN